MSYHCGIGPGMRALGMEPCDPHIKCDTCGLVRSVETSRDMGRPAAWFLNRKKAPGWGLRLEHLDHGMIKRIDTCANCLLREGATVNEPEVVVTAEDRATWEEWERCEHKEDELKCIARARIMARFDERCSAVGRLCDVLPRLGDAKSGARILAALVGGALADAAAFIATRRTADDIRALVLRGWGEKAGVS